MIKLVKMFVNRTFCNTKDQCTHPPPPSSLVGSLARQTDWWWLSICWQKAMTTRYTDRYSSFHKRKANVSAITKQKDFCCDTRKTGKCNHCSTTDRGWKIFALSLNQIGLVVFFDHSCQQKCQSLQKSLVVTSGIQIDQQISSFFEKQIGKSWDTEWCCPLVHVKK